MVSRYKHIPSDPVANHRDSIAIIGLSCRFPGGVTNGPKFWDFLCKARSAHSAPERFNIDAFCRNGNRQVNTSSTRTAHFLQQNIGAFDAGFFSTSYNEALAMDPQQRIMLELAYEAFENAGLPLQAVSGTNTSCYVGTFTTDYREMLLRDPESMPLYSMSGSGSEMISNRISWFYDLRGPSITVNSACSSSLVALHQGCQSLQTGEASMAVVGGSNLLLSPDIFTMLSNQRFLAVDGLCKSFDINGDGYGRGEGFAIVVLKRVSDALRDKDAIRAIIRGSMVNHDGKTKGITVPSAFAQENLIRSTYMKASLELRDTNYIEAHGTGTQAGDPVELEAIAKTFGMSRDSNILVGSAKSNIGHLEATAGLAGLIKGIYILERGMIPPNINFHEANPAMTSEEMRIDVPTEMIVWPSDGLRRLSVQAFGYSGTNAHVIMEDALHYLEERDLDGIHFTNRKAIRNVTWNTSGCTTNRHRPTNLQIGIPRRTARLFILSSQDKEGLNRQRQSFCKFLRSYQEQQQDESQENQHYLRDLAFTLSERRSSLPWKTSFVTSTVDELCSALDNKDQEIRDSRTSGKPRIGFVFTGQGAQWARMACELNRYRIFRDSIEASAEYLQSALKCDWWAVEELSRGRDESNIDLPAYSQPLCTIIQVALVDLLKTWNVVPSVVVGHSSGEIAAAYCTGVLTKQDALKIAYYRGFFSSMISKYSSFQQGAMLAIETSESEVQEWISRVSDGKIVVACINSPRSVTVSGELTGINALQGLAKRYGKFARHLKVDVAYHSPQMDSISAQYYAAIQDLRPHPGTQAPVIYSSTAGCLVEPSELGPIHWVRNLVGPVLFYQALLELMRPGARESNDTANGVDLLVEIGPHSTLQGAIAQSMETHAITDIEYSSILSRGRNGVETALATMGSLFAQGVNVDMAQVNMDDADDIWGDPRMLADLPPYSWNHTRTFWSESRISKEYCFRKQPPGSLVGAPCSSGSENEKSWRKLIRMSEEPWIRHHKIQNAFVYPAAGYIAMVIEAARQMVDMQTVREFCLRDVQIIAPAVLDEESDLECILQLRPHRIGTRDNSSAWFEFTISTCGKEESLRQNCFGLLFIGYEAEEGSGTSVERFEEDQGFKDQHLQAQSSCRTWKDPKVFYDNLANLGLEYGDFFKNLTQIYTSSGKSCCTISFSNVGLLDMDADVKRPHIIHPTNLDAFFHCAFAAMEDQNQLQEALVPTSIDEVTISATVPFGTGTSVRGFSHIEQHGFRQLMADIVIFEHSLFESVVKVKGLCCSPIGPRSGKEAMVKEGTIKTRIDKMVWKPAIGLMSRHQLAHVIGQASAKCSVLTRSAKMERLILYFISRALHRLSIDEVDQTYLPHLYKFLEQHQKLAKSHEDCGLRDVKIEWSCMGEEEQTSARAEMVSLGINYDSICRVGMHFEDLLLGRKQMKDILCGQDLVDLIASLSSQVDGGFEMLSAYADLSTHASPGMSIMEITTTEKTGTSWLVSALSKNPNLISESLMKYTFASPDKATLEKMDTALAFHRDRIHLTSFAIEQDDIGGKGFEEGSFDLVIISNILIVQPDWERVLGKAKKLLKPNGKLCIVQMSNPGLNLVAALTFRSAHQVGERDSFESNDQALAVGLRRTKFDGDLTVMGSDTFGHQDAKLVIAVANGPVDGEVNKPCTGVDEILILEAPNSSSQMQALAIRLMQNLEKDSQFVRRVSWSMDISSLKGKFCICVAELENPILLEPGESDFAILKDLVQYCSGLLWVTSLNHPAGSLALGMARSIRNEIPGCKFRTLQLSTPLHMPDVLAPLIARCALSPTHDDELREEDGILKSCRILEDKSMTDGLAAWAVQESSAAENHRLGLAQASQKMSITTPGLLDSLCLEAEYHAKEILQDDEVEIDVKASGLNFRDVMVSMGHIPDDSLGLEASGIITRVGIDVRGFKPGDSVCTLGQGTHRSLLYNKASYCTPMPRGLSFEQAATLPLVHCTAFYALQYIARACPGQTVLIHSAAGGVGQAAIQLAQHIGLVIFATVGATEKREFIKQEFGIPEGHIFNSRDLSFAKGIKRMTSGRGVDCVINSLSGEAQRRSWECVAPGGTFVEIGMKDILANTRLEMRPFLQDATFSFFNLKNVMTNRPKVMIKVINGTFDLLRRGITRPVLPLTVYPVAQMERGFRLMQSGNHIGKIAFAWSEEENVPAELKVRASLKLDDKTTYMLVGGFGGLGRSLSKMLVELGARYLCFISRSEAQSASSLDLLQELEAKAVRTVAYKCDISNREQLAQTLVKCSQEMPRLGGVIQCAMVLRDAFFEKMTWHEWRESLQPKVLGSWNLHLLLPKPLDFFIMLSSFAGIFGNRGQSNYGAAGAYQDALAHHRQSLGLKAVTIDLGIVRDVGVLAKAGNAKSHIKEWGEHFGMRESELHCLIKYVIHNEVSTNANTETAPSTTTSSTPSQILTGFATGGAAEGAGIEQPYYLSDPRFSVLAQTGLNTRGGPPTSAEKSAKLPLRDLLMHCPSFADAQRLVTQAMKSHVERMLQAAVGEIDGTRPLHSYGIDSLVGVEITNWIYRETKVQLSIMEVLASMPMVELAGKIAVKSPFCAKEASGAQT